MCGQLTELKLQNFIPWEDFHSVSLNAALRRRIKVSHPNLYAFLSHLQNTTADQMSDVSRLRNGLNIPRPKSKTNIVNESRVKSCLAKFDNGSYSRLHFLRAVSHSMVAHTAALQPADSDSDADDGDDSQSTAATSTTASTALHTAAGAAADTTCEVCFVAPREGFALVPCGHARFCESCANRVAVMNRCPVCRSNITMVMRNSCRRRHFVMWIITDFWQFVLLIVRFALNSICAKDS